MDKEDIEKLIDSLPKKIAKSITMKQSYYDKLMNSSFVLKTNNLKEGMLQQFDGLPVYIDDDIENDYEVNY
jgi:transcriptional regulator of met regulon